MALADLIVIIILLLFTLAGLKRGVIWELFTTLGLVLAFVLVYVFRDSILDLVLHVTKPGWERQWGGTLVFLFFFLIVYLGFAALGRFIHNNIKNPILKTSDHILGLAAGLLKGAVLVAMLVLTLDLLEGGGKLRNFVYESKIIRWGKETVSGLMHWESQESRQWVMDNSVVILNKPSRDA